MTTMIILKDMDKKNEASKALTQDDIIQPNISEHDFRSSNDVDNMGYGLHAFDIRYQKNFESAQSIKVEFKFVGVMPVGVYGYGILLTNKWTSISTDGQRIIDLV